MEEIDLSYNVSNFILLGDFNGRVGNLNEMIDNEDFDTNKLPEFLNIELSNDDYE